MTDKGLTDLLEAFGQGLLSLSINACCQLTDVSIMKIREYCRNLEELDISDLVGISTEALLGLFIIDGSTIALADDEQELAEDMMNGNRPGQGKGVHNGDDDDDGVNGVTAVTPASSMSLTAATNTFMDPIGRAMRSIR